MKLVSPLHLPQAVPIVVVAVLLGVAAAAFLYRRRRRQQQAEATQTAVWHEKWRIRRRRKPDSVHSMQSTPAATPDKASSQRSAEGAADPNADLAAVL